MLSAGASPSRARCFPPHTLRRSRATRAICAPAWWRVRPRATCARCWRTAGLLLSCLPVRRADADAVVTRVVMMAASCLCPTTPTRTTRPVCWAAHGLTGRWYAAWPFLLPVARSRSSCCRWMVVLRSSGVVAKRKGPANEAGCNSSARAVGALTSSWVWLDNVSIEVSAGMRAGGGGEEAAVGGQK